MGLNAKQIEQLLRPVNPKRVQKDRNGMSHLAGYDVSAHLTRIFGFGGWEKRVRSLELVSEEGIKSNDGKRTGWYVTYRCQMTLDVKDPSGEVIWSNDDGATGSASNIPVRGEAHDFALKNAITYALKRCAKDLGDQFGLSLYNAGSLKPIVGQVLSLNSDGDVEQALPDELHPDTDDHAAETAPERPAPASNGNGRTVRPTATPKPPPPAEGIDPDAQAFASDAQEARSLAALRTVWTAASKAGKLTAFIADAQGEKLTLRQHIEGHRKQLEDDTAALDELMKASDAARISTEDLEAHVHTITGTTIEGASAAQLREAAQALAMAGSA